MIRNYLTVAWRNLLRNKLYSLINVIGLSIGISACLVIFLIVHHELTFDQFHPGGDRIYRVYTHMTGDYNGSNRGVHSGFAPTAKNELTGVEAMAGFHIWSTDVDVTDAKNGRREFDRQFGLIFAGPEYFDVFGGYHWIAGSPAASLGKPFQLVLSENKAKTYFGVSDPKEAMGKEIHYSDSMVLTVSGIVKDQVNNTDLDFQDFISFSTIDACWMKKSIRMDSWEGTSSSSQFFVKLIPGTTPEQVTKVINKMAEGHQKKDPDGHEHVDFQLQPLSDIHFNSELEIFDHTSRSATHLPTLQLQVVVALLLLAIASINFVNLETAQAARRAKEVGIRKVIGSRRGELVVHFLMQSFLLTTCAVILSLPLAEFAIIFFKDFVPPGLTLRLGDPTLLMFLGGAMIGVSLLAGLYPALSLSGMLPAAILKNQVITASGESRAGFIRKGLIVFQFTVAQTLIVATLIVGWQIRYMLAMDLGFSKEAIVWFETPWWEKHAKVQALKNELAAIPEINAVTLCMGPPAYTSWRSTTMVYKNGKDEFRNEVYFKCGDTSYLNVFGIKLLAGRYTHPSDSLTEIVINETYSKLLGFRRPEDAIDKMIEADDKMHPVVGVIRDFNFSSLHSKVEPAVMGDEESNFSCFGVKLNSAGSGTDLKRAIEKLEAAWKKVYPDQKFEHSFVDETVAKFYDKEQRTSKLVNTAAAIAILISCMGLFGLASFTTMQRTKEIGIRKVLGASVNSIVGMLSREFLWLVAIAFVVAVPIAYYTAEGWLADFAYRTDVGWQVFVWTLVASVVIVMISISYQAIKAATTDPVKSLRYE